MWGECSNCSAKTLIGKNFCNSCGFDLRAAFEEMKSGLDSRIASARELAKAGKLIHAIRAVESVSSTDFRLKEEVETAQQLASEYKQSLKAWQEKMDQLPTQAKSLIEENQFQSAVEILSPIPDSMVTDEISALLDEAKGKSETTEKSKRGLKQAIADKDWAGAMYELSVLSKLYPEKEKYRTLTQQISEKIGDKATALVGHGKHTEALTVLDAIPVDSQSDKHRELRSSLEELVFLRKLIAASPFANGLVGEALTKVAKLTPGDATMTQLRGKFQKIRSAKPEKAFHLKPRWMKVRSGTYDTSIPSATLPTTLRGCRPDALAKSGAQFWSAFGLSIQGLGLGQETSDLLRPTKAGVLSRIGRKKKVTRELAWGVDIGDASIKAILLKNSEVGIEIRQAVTFPIGDPTSDGNTPKSTVLFRTLEKVFADSMFGETAMVCNMPSSDLLARYLDLPADNPNQHEMFITQEAQANIPIALDMLSTCFYRFDKAEESSVSQHAVLMALRQNDVASRKSMMKKLGVNLVGITPEPLANVNTLVALDYLGEIGDRPLDGMLLVDVGYLKTTIQFCCKAGTWYRTIDWGIQNLNSSLATGLKLTLGDADSLRRNLIRSRALNESVGLLRNACAIPKREIERSVRAAQEQFGEAKVISPILIGGGAYQPLLGSLLNDEKNI